MSRFMPGVIAMAAIVVASNILVQHQLGNFLTWGAISYPFAFLVTDVMNRVYGPAPARRVVLAGFVAGVACSLVAAGAGLTTLRIAIASGTAFLVAQMVDIAVFHLLRHGGAWWRAPFASSLIGSALDTALFFSIAFAAGLSWIDPGDDVAWANQMVAWLGFGPDAALWVSLASADWLVKMALAVVALVPFRVIVNNILRRRAAF